MQAPEALYACMKVQMCVDAHGVCAGLHASSNPFRSGHAETMAGEQVGAPLVVLNLSQQTDSSDLLGGFRPVQPRDALLPLLARLQARAHLRFLVCILIL